MAGAIASLSMTFARPIPLPMMDVPGSPLWHQVSAPEDFLVDMWRPRHIVMTTGGHFSQKLAGLDEALNVFNGRIHIVPIDVQDVDGAIQDHADLVENSHLTPYEKGKFLYYRNEPAPEARAHEHFFIKGTQAGQHASMNALPLAALQSQLTANLPVHLHLMSKPKENEVLHILEAAHNRKANPELIFHRLDDTAGLTEGQESLNYANKLLDMAHDHGVKEVVWANDRLSWGGQDDPTSVSTSVVEPHVSSTHIRNALEAHRLHVPFNDAAHGAALHHALNHNPQGDPAKGARLQRVSFGLGSDGLISATPDVTSQHKMIVDARMDHAIRHFDEAMGQSRRIGNHPIPSSSRTSTDHSYY